MTKLNTLRQSQLTPPIDSEAPRLSRQAGTGASSRLTRNRLATHIASPSITSRLSAASRILFLSKSARHLWTTRTNIDIDLTTITPGPESKIFHWIKLFVKKTLVGYFSLSLAFVRIDSISFFTS